MTSMEKLQQEIAETIFLPKHLTSLITGECQDEIWILLNILYTECVDTEFLSDRMVFKTQLDFDNQSEIIKSICNPAEYFMIMVWITQTAEKWIQSAVLVDEFETATNLKKVLKLDE